MNDFLRTLEELKTEKATFSKTDLTKLATSLLNTYDYTGDNYKVKNGEVVVESIKPTEEFRSFIYKILLEFGVDKQDAQKVMTEYKFNKTDWMYNVMSEIMYQYLNTGHKFTFVPKSDFVGSIQINTVNECTKEYTNPQTKEKFKKEIPTHRVLKKSSSCPSWKTK